MVKSMVGFSKNSAILFAMFHRGSISDPSGVNKAPMPVCPTKEAKRKGESSVNEFSTSRNTRQRKGR